MAKMIKLKNITKVYDNFAKKTQVKVFENFDFDINKNEITCIFGKSGCGKTTLLNILAKSTPFSGEIQGSTDNISYIFQEPRLLQNLTVKQNLLFVKKDATDSQIDEILSVAEIKDKADVYSGELSGGQAQRVSIARAFITPSELLLMDEPFSSLDTALKIRLAKAFLSMWQRDKRTVLFVTHDLEEAFMLSHRIVVMDKGKIVFDIRPEGQIPRPYGSDMQQKRKMLDKILIDA